MLKIIELESKTKIEFEHEHVKTKNGNKNTMMNEGLTMALERDQKAREERKQCTRQTDKDMLS